jgi:hypothetical protein
LGLAWVAAIYRKRPARPTAYPSHHFPAAKPDPRPLPIKKAFVLPLDEFVAGWYDESVTKININIVNETLSFFS